jgi:16S rRNA (cytosine1402-N4)-methyltransferase
VVDLLRPRPGALFVDGTLGWGGHAEALLDAGVQLVGVDRDPDALAAASARLARFGDRVELHHAPFSAIPRVLGERRADGVLLDLGVSSPQLDRPERGFSFRADGPLDMRMDPTGGESLAELLDRVDEVELADALWRLGEERHSRRVARAILAARPLRGTAHLADVIRSVVPRDGRIDGATRSFQALRMLVNHEVDELADALERLPGLLAPGGRLGIISFHSGEDTQVKRRFAALAGIGAPTDLFGNPLHPPAFHLVERRARKGEADPNPRARSARLRVLERNP